MTSGQPPKDDVQRASEGSFPASDAPGWTPVTGSGAPAHADEAATASAPLILRAILFPTDFSPSSQHAFAMARSLAQDHGARLILLHVIEPMPVVPGEGMIPAPAEPSGEREKILEQLRQFAPPSDKVPIEYRVTDGNAATAILHTAMDAHCDLIVMGTHGRTGLGRLLMGSVAEAVLRQATCPVLTIKA